MNRSEVRHLRWLFAGILVAIGALDVIGALLSHHQLRDQFLQQLVPVEVSLGGRTGIVLSGLALALLAVGISRGKRIAWRLTILILLASAGLHVVTDLALEEALIAVWLALGLWWMRRHFTSATDPISLRRGLLAMAGGIAVAVAYAVIGSWLLRGQLSPAVTASRSLHHLTHAVTHTSPAWYQPLTQRAEWFLNSMPFIAWALVLYGLLHVLHPMVLRQTMAVEERGRLRSALGQWGHNPIAYLALLPDKRYFWFGSDTCLAYRVEGRVALVLGDPIGPPVERQDAIEAFLDFCASQDWTPAFYQTESDQPYRGLGFTLLPIGLDAVVPLKAFTLATPSRAELRYALRRAQRLGIRLSFLSGPQAWASCAVELRAVSEEWLQGKGREMGFSLGGLETIRDDPEIVVGLACDGEGRVLAFVSWLPVPSTRQWTLDLIRRRRNGVPELMDALLTASMLEAQQRGIRSVSLGLAPMALPNTPAPTWTGNLFRLMYSQLDRLHGSRSLRRFKAKYGPCWEPRYLAASSAAAVPETLVALMFAHYPALRAPWRLWLQRRQPAPALVPSAA